MGKIEDAVANQLRNIETATGQSIAEWSVVIQASGRAKHGEVVTWLKQEHGLTHGNANALAHATRNAANAAGDSGGSGGPGSTGGSDLVDAQYAGAKAHLRPIYERLVAAALDFGPDVEVSPKKTGVSLRRSKQFALVEAPSAKRVVLGLNNASFVPTDRLVVAKGMCSHQVVLTGIDEVDDDVLGWMRAAYDQA